MHWRVVRSFYRVEQIEKLARPVAMDAGSPVLVEFPWYVVLLHQLPFEFTWVLFVNCMFCARSESTGNDNVQGLEQNAGGSGIVAFGVSDLGFSYIVSICWEKFYLVSSSNFCFFSWGLVLIYNFQIIKAYNLSNLSQISKVLHLTFRLL